MLLAHAWRPEDGWFDTVMVNRLHIIDKKTKMYILIWKRFHILAMDVTG